MCLRSRGGGCESLEGYLYIWAVAATLASTGVSRYNYNVSELVGLAGMGEFLHSIYLTYPPLVLLLVLSLAYRHAVGNWHFGSRSHL